LSDADQHLYAEKALRAKRIAEIPRKVKRAPRDKIS
jgi:hypothetical protein